ASLFCFFFSSRRRHTRCLSDWSSDVCSSDLVDAAGERVEYDPSEASYEGAFVATFHDYVRRELKWDSDTYYTVSANVRPWDQTRSEERRVGKEGRARGGQERRRKRERAREGA